LAADLTNLFGNSFDRCVEKVHTILANKPKERNEIEVFNVLCFASPGVCVGTNLHLANSMANQPVRSECFEPKLRHCVRPSVEVYAPCSQSGQPLLTPVHAPGAPLRVAAHGLTFTLKFSIVFLSLTLLTFTLSDARVVNPNSDKDRNDRKD